LRMVAISRYRKDGDAEAEHLSQLPRRYLSSDKNLQ
jgi:hypothetical protein